MKTGFFNASVAMSGLTAGFQKLANVLKHFSMPDPYVKREYEPRVRKRNRRRRRSSGRFNEDNRFTRKMRKYGSEYRPGKLFKGHRV